MAEKDGTKGKPRPIEGTCTLCGKTFVHPLRKQGGGKVKKYCSINCSQRAWYLGNPEKRKAIVTKYDAVPENKEKRKLYARGRLLKEYGWSMEDFVKELQRQNYQCNGCLNKIDEVTARVDHSHSFDVVRGLLCDSCNWSLGHAKDNPATLRRLMAYLDHDRSKKNIYLIGALKNPRIPVIGNLLRKEGYDVMDEWFTPGEFADTNWQAYEKLRGRSYSDALRGRSATNTFLFDRAYLDLADVAVLVAPAGKSAMAELGYSKGRGKTVYIFLDNVDPERFDIMPGLADKVLMTEEDLITELKKGDHV